MLYNVGGDICSAAVRRTHCLLPWQRLQCVGHLPTATYVCQQYKGKALSRVHGNSGYANAPRCYRGADKSLARPTSRCSLFDGENISFDPSFVVYINSTNIPPIMLINGIYETQNLLSL